MIFDTHLHLVDRKRLSYPWLAGVPALDRDWGYEEYETVARRLGITDVLHMEVDVAEGDIDAETAAVAALMDRPGSLIRGAISAARPECESFVPWLERVDRRIVRGVRRVLHTQPDDLSRTRRFRDNLSRLGAAGLPFDLCVLARQLPLAVELADAAPDTVLVLDHCGVPDIAGGDFAPWAGAIADLARRPNVWLKLSGIPSYGPATWSLQTLRPWVDHVLDRFGPGRMVWGSDHPVCSLNASLAQWVAASHALLVDLSPDEKAAILQANARRVWAFPG